VIEGGPILCPHHPISWLSVGSGGAKAEGGVQIRIGFGRLRSVEKSHLVVGTTLLLYSISYMGNVST
jgi:hypothetical protein